MSCKYRYYSVVMMTCDSVHLQALTSAAHVQCVPIATSMIHKLRQQLAIVRIQGCFSLLKLFPYPRVGKFKLQTSHADKQQPTQSPQSLMNCRDKRIRCTVVTLLISLGMNGWNAFQHVYVQHVCNVQYILQCVSSWLQSEYIG